MGITKRQGSGYAGNLLEASFDPLFVISPDGKIIDVNDTTLNATDKTRNKITGTNFFHYFTEPKNARKAYKQIFAKGFIKDYPLHNTGVSLPSFIIRG